MSLPARIDRYRFPGEASWPRIADDRSGATLPHPPFSTVSGARKRAELARRGVLQRIRFTPAWGSAWPLWSGVDGPVTPGQLALSASLESALRSWTDQWISAGDAALVKDCEVGGLLPDPWFEAGEKLLAAVAEETWTFADVFPYFRTYRRSSGGSPLSPG